MRRGIREMKHQRIMFADLDYTPNQNPYKPQGIRKLDEAWVNPDGDGYVSLFPGYTQLDTLSDTSVIPYGMRLMTGWDASAGYLQYPIVMFYIDNTSTKVYKLDSNGEFTDNLIHEFTAEEVYDRARGGSIPGYSYKTYGYLFTGSWGSDAGIGVKFDLDAYASPNETIGLARPDVSGSSSALGGNDGAVKGVVKYYVSYTGQDGIDEGALSEEFGEIDAGDGSDVDLSDLPTKDTNKRRLYRTFKDGDQPFYLATLNDSDTDYTDNIADADLGDLPLKMGDPPQNTKGYQSAVWHYGRAYILSNNDLPRRVYFSDPEEPESFFTSEFGNWFSINDGYRAQVLSRVPEGLIYLTEHSAYLLVGRDPNDFVLHELVPVTQGSFGVGCASLGGCKETHLGTFFYDKASYSIYKVSPRGTLEQTAQGQLSTISESVSEDFRDYELNDDSDIDTRFNLGWWSKHNILFASQGRDGGQMWAYDADTGRWIGRASYAPKSICHWESSSDPLALACLSSENDERDSVYQMLSGTGRNGTAATQAVVGAPTFTGSDPTIEKTFHYVDVLLKPADSTESLPNLDFTVYCYIDGASTSAKTATVTTDGTNSRERHRVYINQRGRELDVDVHVPLTSTTAGVYGLIFGYTEETSVAES